MKKVMVIHRYGENWDYGLYVVSDRIAERAEKLMERGDWESAYELVSKNDRSSEKLRKKDDWHSLDTIDILLEYIEGVSL
jgi:hypothetical protein